LLSCQVAGYGLQVNVKVNSKPVALKNLYNNKIPNLKHQITNKSQYSMTKISTTVVSHRFAKPVLPVMIQLGTTVDGLFVWNFEFGSL
jgi:hypothetical protein